MAARGRAVLAACSPIAFGAGYACSAVLNGMLGRDPLPSLVVTFGLSIVIQNLLAGSVLRRPALASTTGGLNIA